MRNLTLLYSARCDSSKRLCVHPRLVEIYCLG